MEVKSSWQDAREVEPAGASGGSGPTGASGN